MNYEQSLLAVVAYRDFEAQQPRFRRYAGHLFGLLLAVTAFNRYPRMFQAFFSRRLMRSPISLYFDDAIVVDWQSHRGTVRQAVGHLAKELGSPFAPAKHQSMSESGDF